MPSVAGSTVQMKLWLAVAPLPSVAVTVTVLVPAVLGVPVIAPVEALIDRPAGRLAAEYLSVWPLVASLALTGTETAVPARPSWAPGAVMVTGVPIWFAATASVPVSGRLALESPTEMP